MLADPDNIDFQTHVALINPLEDNYDVSENFEDGKGVERYLIVIKNLLTYALAVECVSASCSFCQAVEIL